MIPNLRKCRKDKGMTQAELAGKIGVKKSSISMYEIGKRHPSFSVLKKLSETLGISIDRLVSDKCTSNQSNKV